MTAPFIIAEIGSNCFKYDLQASNLSVALRQIRAAKAAGADAVKFQMFTSEELYGQVVAGVDKWSLPRDWVPTLKEAAEDAGIEFMCTAFSVEGYQYIDKYVKRHKVASCEVLDLNIASWCTSQPKQVFWSNGCAEVDVLSMPVEADSHHPKNVVMKCVSKYPAEIWDYDFSHSESFPWGLSDHTAGSLLGIIARARGCDFFEKHVDFLPHLGSGPDTCVSSNAEEFKEYVERIHEQELVRVHDLQHEARGKWGRRLIGNQFFRPLPK